MIRMFGVIIAAFMLIAVVGCKKDVSVSTLPDAEKAEMEKSIVEDSQEIQEAKYLVISPEEAKQILSENPDAILVDVRPEDDYLERHIVGAISLPRDEIAEKAAQILPNKDAVILLYCTRGIKSKEAGELLSDMGYANLYNMGGINDGPYETESGNGNE